MHLCYLLPPIERYSPALGGAIATFAMQQGRRLQALGYRISVIAPHEKEEFYEVGEFAPLHGVTRESLSALQRGLSSKVRRPLLKFDWLYFEHYRAQSTRALRKLRPDAVLCFNDWQTPLFVRKTLPDARVFLRLSNECRTKLPDSAPTIAVLEHIFAVSSYILGWTAREMPASAPKLSVLPNGADLDSFFPALDALERVLEPKSHVKALFLSRLDPNKGPDLAADAVMKLRKNGAALSLSIAGGLWFNSAANSTQSPFVQLMQSKAQDAGAHLLGHVERPLVPQLMREHDVFLLPIRNNDPMPQAVFEAMASGLAIVSCALGGMEEACGDAALWARPNDADSLAAQLQRLESDRDFLVERKRKSLERAQSMTWDHNAATFDAVLRAARRI